MKIFVTGASGFVGTAVTKKLIEKGHQVLGLVRSESAASKLTEIGATPVIGTLDDLDILTESAANADGVIHTAFNHDFTKFAENAAQDKLAIETMGKALIGTSKAIVATGGLLDLPAVNGVITEESQSPAASPRFSESAIMGLAGQGVAASIVRLAPCVHGMFGTEFRAGFGLRLVQLAQEKGFAAYIGKGENHWCGANVADVADIYVLALGKGLIGQRYNAVSDNDVFTIKEFAEYLGNKLNLPVESISPEQAPAYFEWMMMFIGLDCPTANNITQSLLNWKPTGINLLKDMDQHFS